MNRSIYTRLLYLLAVLAITAAPPLGASEQPAGTSAVTVEKNESLQERLVETEHQITIAGETIHYTATAGNLILKDPSGKGKASCYFTAYERQGIEDSTTRPVTFIFNGGPGSSSVWLHLGAFGPKRVALPDGPHVPAVPPYHLQENEHSLIDMTDIVFIDPIATGFSKAASDEPVEQFLGVEEDAKVIAEFIRLYVTRTGRWASPKFLAGESYGTTRAAALAEELQDTQGIYLNGVVLISSILNWQHYFTFDNESDIEVGNEVPFLTYFPTYTATGWYHGLLPEDLQQKSLPEALAEAEQFVRGPYTTALMKGSRLGSEERQQIIDGIRRYTGLREGMIDRHELRIGVGPFAKKVLGKDRKVVGWYDTRIASADVNPAGAHMINEPSGDAITGAFTALMNDYLANDLQWKTDDRYMIMGEEVWNHWNWSATNRYVNVAPALRRVLMRSPKTRVMVASGYYDLATPYFAMEHTIEHMQLDAATEQRIQTHYYEAGHMMYTEPKCLEKLKGDMAEFYRVTLQG